MRFKKIAAFVLLAVMFITLMAGCVSKTSTQENTNTSGGVASGKNTLVIGALSDFKQGSGKEGQSMVFDLMTQRSESMGVEPGIIESWTTNADLTEYTLKVRQNVKFTDGTPLTADIVKYSLQAWAPYCDGSFMYSLKSMDVVNDTTLDVKFTKSYGNFPTEMTRIYVSLPGSLDDKGNVVKWVGTGPFILDDYQTDQSATLKTNKDYWNKNKIPSIDGVKWVVIPDENSRIMALQSGQVDVVGVAEHYCALSYAAVAELKKDDKYVVDLNPDSGLIATYVYNYAKGPMTDINLRKAVTYAIDRKTLVDTVVSGLGAESGDFMRRKYDFSPRNEKEYTYDLDAAKAALTAGGYADTNGDGIVEKDGQPVVLRFVVESDETARATAVFVQDCLKKIGIDTKLEALDDSARAEKEKNGDFDIAYTHPWLTTPQTYMSWRGAVNTYDDFGIGFGVSGNFSTYLDEVLSKSSKDDLWNTFDKVWAEEYAFYPGTGLYTTPRVFIHSKDVTGFIFNPNECVIDLSGMKITGSK
ncbi:hypothetical protein ASJ81_11680 [Methanosarcina spelaei]|uniref:Solute-binding protein family 5 domain-containing protein n=1 Tax=Methanosarcina spelaei TaxID=1036679 RepID=A0A2A2HNH0_9EURY|nr:ABC transporter substrate-binding protein [Methanosarcina spelaei]PAV11039.1 hypothetical protein ASJ81_11680 [Methanosarcina spelaei]